MLEKLPFRIFRSANLQLVFYQIRKGPTALFCGLSIGMIHYLDSTRFYTNRTYLTQWFDQDILVVTDMDFENTTKTQQLLNAHPLQNQVLDNTHNPYPDSKIVFKINPTLTNNFDYWYSPEPGIHFFPLFLWMYSLKNPLWYENVTFDTVSNKTQTIMCLNGYSRPHRTWMWDKFNQKNLLDKMMYTFSDYYKLLNDVPGDAGLGHDVYSKYSVNIVTETSIDLSYISEKTCKPFIAKQIPVIVGSVGVNKFLKDVGLDMFEDIVPWQNWDSEVNSFTRLERIVDFIEQWINRGTILNDYQRVLSRVDYNKNYFHSEEFRNRIMTQMTNFNL